MRVAVVFGTRPEIIRLSRVIAKLDDLCDLRLVYTGQNYDPNLSDIFFEELQVRKPNHHWGVQAGGFGAQIGEIIRHSEEYLREETPDRLLILGDTNSGLAAVVAARMGIPVYHMEAGNRCYDDRVPEEINRRIIDHCSNILMPYTHRSKENLLREGFERQRIFVTGNPIFEVLEYNKARIDSSDALAKHGVQPGEYFLVTLHRAENVDDPQRLNSLLEGLDLVASTYNLPVIVSFHPRTRDKVEKLRGGVGAGPKSGVSFVTPLGFFDFVKLEKHAKCVLTDSGTVQEETVILNVPSVIVRDVTERAETQEAGSGILSGASPESILRSVKISIAQGADWQPPEEYVQENVSSVVANIVLGYRR